MRLRIPARIVGVALCGGLLGGSAGCESSAPTRSAGPPRIAADARWESVAQDLVLMRTRDEAIRRRVAEGGGAATPEARTELKELTDHNTARLRQIVDAVGWPREQQVGERAAAAAWYLLERADADPGFQMQVLERLRPLVDQGELPRDEFDSLWKSVSGRAGGSPAESQGG